MPYILAESAEAPTRQAGAGIAARHREQQTGVVAFAARNRLAEQRAVEREFALLGVEPALTEEGLECFPEHEVVFWEVDAPDVLIGVAEE